MVIALASTFSSAPINSIAVDMAYVGTILGLGSITGSAAGLGFLMGSSIIGLVSFAIGKAQVPDPNDITYSFKIGLDGAGYNEGYDPLAGAGGGAPGVRAFDNQGRKIGQTRHRKKCVDGQDYCTQVVKDMPEQPAYALITGRSDPVCVAAVGVTYPSGDKYGWVGNWAHTCSQPWYYSDIDAQYENGTIKLDCVWLGSKGYKKGYSTGIRIHFPEFKQGREANGHNEAYYCSPNNTALAFYKNKSPKYFDGSSVRDRTVRKKIEKDAKKAIKKRPTSNKFQKRTVGMERRWIQSHYAGHSAKFLCASETAVGPSLTSMTERAFCHMPDKVLYPFCSDVKSGTCWDEQANKFDAKGPGAIHARAALPDVEFEAPIVWGK